MKVPALYRDSTGSRARTREAMGVSTVLHLLVFIWFALNRASAGELAGLTEITFIEETDPMGEPNAAPPMARETTSSAPVQEVSLKASREAQAPQHHERALERASAQASR